MERFERRILDEFVKMYNDSDSFYFSFTGDLTNSLQRQTATDASQAESSEDCAQLPTSDGAPAPEVKSPTATHFDSPVVTGAPLWRGADDRFFFNKPLVQELLDLNDSRADPFILPIIQGYVELLHAPLDLDESDNFYSDFAGHGGGGGAMLSVRTGDRLPDYYTVALISRRSRHRYGKPCS